MAPSANSPEGNKGDDAQTDVYIYIDTMYVYTCIRQGFS